MEVPPRFMRGGMVVRREMRLMGEVMEVLLRVKRSGMVRGFGKSNGWWCEDFFYFCTRICSSKNETFFFR